MNQLIQQLKWTNKMINFYNYFTKKNLKLQLLRYVTYYHKNSLRNLHFWPFWTINRSSSQLMMMKVWLYPIYLIHINSHSTYNLHHISDIINAWHEFNRMWAKYLFPVFFYTCLDLCCVLYFLQFKRHKCDTYEKKYVKGFFNRF